MSTDATSRRLASIAAQLRVAGDRGNRVALLRGLKSGAKPLIPLVRAAAERDLPKSGGLAKKVASERVTVSVRTGANTAGVRLRTPDLGRNTTDEGYVRHKVYGHWRKGVPTQQVTGGWWSSTLAQSGPSVTPALVAELDKVSRTINGHI